MVRIAPDNITELKPNEIFVFGSNREGMHGAGAALHAHKNFGAILGQGHGLQGQSYAIDTMSGYDTMKEQVALFMSYSQENRHLTFLVTAIGCGIAGHHPSKVALLFKTAHNIDNIYLPEIFLKS